MNIGLIILIGFVFGIIGGLIGTYISNSVLKDIIKDELEKYQNDVNTAVSFALDDFNEHVITDISDVRNDIGKSLWLDDLTIKGLNDNISQISNKVDNHLRWSLGVWNDISHMDTTEIREKLGVPLKPLPEEPYHFEFKDTDEQDWTDGTGDA